ncbi:GNAT family N-acetyltransferase [Paenibacillus larvae]|uniref:GNAT family N-acetyltransferase n=1 Tax=Paenibacillus larvae TaxID=1464 RepID=UPI00288E6598|nr:GNAT family N-acetyltransferase [Paenibacillus larvae]MDT2194604.1 GNAT family N-acetyltransferase [Paenibacillus larvae]MDT2237137.1 GNAT family N-acetyltransferase [Paenibacillus larvae]MDT2247510.1 GNAT family N-acetyltransferase [Paenibacillus larvae]MDT2261122.1 GNAT family N-acetyltransferase [Paenibacillus larvae]MDT2264434.1 GNAT family N-acetyltransferase [Paenibacillus larvae]
MDLAELYTSFEFRGLGIGKQLFALCAEKARQWGAKKLYISAHSAEETQAFYRSVGCVDAVEINQQLADKEPFDIQMEYIL